MAQDTPGNPGNDSTPRPPQAPLDIVAAADQMAASMGTFAQVLNSYRSALVAGGMRRAEAFQLVADYQQMFFTRQFYPDGVSLIEVEGIDLDGYYGVDETRGIGFDEGLDGSGV